MKKFTIEYVKEFCKSLELECVSDKYVNIKSNLDFKCPKCNEIFQRSFDNIKTRKAILCDKCSKKRAAKSLAFTYEEVKHFVEFESGSNCKLLSDSYVNVDSKLLFECECKNKFETSFYKFKNRNKRQCNDCGLLILKEKNLTPLEDIVDIVEEEEYRVLDNDTSGGDQKILVQCNNNHKPYWVRISKFKRGQRCPHCDRSLGEELVSKELDRQNIKYKQQYTFDNLIGLGGRLLRFDFALFNNNKLLCLIEYDGKQHFEPAFGDIDGSNLLKIQEHDNRKNNYAKHNKIPLYRIPYTKYDEIPEIINKIINQ